MKFFGLRAAMAVLMLSGACTNLDKRLETDSEVSAIAEAPYLWNRGSSIPVCWKTPGYGLEKSTIQNAITREFVRRTPLRFSWSASCDGVGYPAIRIAVVTGGDRPNSFIGKSSAEITMNLNFGLVRCQGPNRDNCLIGDGLHEFGHAIGFAHEQDRLDSTCNEEPSRSGKGISLGGGEDTNSIMNYCNNHYFDTPVTPTLSRRDVDSIFYIYAGEYFAHNGATHFRWRGQYCSFPYQGMYQMHGFAFRAAPRIGLADPASEGLFFRGACELPAGYYSDGSATFFTPGNGKYCGFPSAIDYAVHKMQYNRESLLRFGVVGDASSFLGSTGMCQSRVDKPFYVKPGNNGTVSCGSFCGRDGPKNYCGLAQRRDTGEILSCGSVPGLIRNGDALLCWCYSVE